MKKIALLIISALLISGCATTPEANSEFSAADLKFAEEMIPHHEQAVLMSDIALTNSTSDEVLALARDIKAAQAPEIEQMSAWEGVRPSTHMGHMMDHEGAIKMAQKVTGSTNKDVAALAAAIIEAQEKEIAFMKELIKFY